MNNPMRVVSLLIFLSIVITIIICPCNGNLISVPCKEYERQALLMLKQDLKDPSNRLSSWVGGEGDCCNWTGVICDKKTGHVRELHLGNYYSDEEFSSESSSLGGKLNPSLLNLKHLSYLDLYRNDFEEIQIPSFLGSLKSLRYLNLSEARFGGTIPPQLGNLSSLRTLDLFDNPLVVENLQWISGLSLLQHLNIAGINLSKVSHWLQGTNTLPSQLVELYMSECDLGVLPSGISNMTSLRVLNLDYNSISSIIPKWLYTFSNLETLVLSENNFHGEISSSIGNLTALVNLYTSDNQLDGKIPNSLGNLCKLMVLEFSRNNFSGSISEIFESLSTCSSGRIELLGLSDNNLSGHLSQLGNFKNLGSLDFSSNSISGPIPVSLGNLSCLERLNIGNNQLEGVVSEVHFTNLTKLKYFYASENSLTLKTSLDWLPPFQLNTLLLNSWHLEPSELPAWLQTQTKLYALNLSNTALSGIIPTWFWNFSSLGLGFLDISHNRLYGKVPNIDSVSSEVINLGSNQFHGSLPLFSSHITTLDLSNSSFSGTLFHFLCDKTDGPKQLEILRLQDNFLSGKIPDCLDNLQNLTLLNLENNSLGGKIPASVGHLGLLQSLHLRNNHLSGEVPTSLQKCESLFLLDLHNNEFVGSIPTWIGKSLSHLGILSLRSNMLHDNIPHELCSLRNLQILDLADNHLSGAIPTCFKNFTAMANFSNSRDPILFSSESFGDDEVTFEDNYIENAILVRKGREMEYDKILTLVTSLDLLDNFISGEIPEELTSLICLQSFNLSGNLLVGNIPSKIGDMRWLESLDFSRNKLTGQISPSMSKLKFLSNLNLSYNYLTGQIPESTQLQSLDRSSFFGNKLCGPPLEKCSTTHGESSISSGDQKNGGIGRLLEDGWLDLSLGLGFAFGFWSVLGSLLLNMPWSTGFLQFQNNIVSKLYAIIQEKL
ncbi:unnamed protein product [Malus baccata var. baccata]